MYEYDAEKDQVLFRYDARTRRVEALAAFLKEGAMMPRFPAGAVPSSALVAYSAACEAALLAIKSIASRS